MKVEIYGAPWCGFCKQAKKVCEANEIDHAYYDIEATPSHRTTLDERLGEPAKTIPQIFVDGELVKGGYNSFVKLV